ncbi:hypothetical protein GCM10007392_48150 [Saccharospirillum salsuginis]|uniref:histidine kinase n=2 Tax=Saccharospirillum salsuginis TaxID=418750 RepID=A0A918KSH2_9GAMM|nr:hypothetical protein GCM10007392_48150 [Saccharospirillum salsuginis]
MDAAASAHLNTSGDSRPFSLLDTVALPCVVFDARQRLLFANRPFRREFQDTLTPRLRLDDFMQRFHSYDSAPTLGPGTRSDSIATTDQERDEEVYDPETRQSYVLHSRPLRPVAEGGTVLTLQNLTETRSSQARSADLQEQLMLTSRSMSVGEMATTIAHELNQPLGAILNYLGVVRNLLDGQPEHGRALEGVSAALLQAERATAVIARIREFVRTREPKKEPCRVADLVHSVISLLSLEIRQQRVRVDCDLATDLPSIQVDRIMMELVVANLVRNALDAMSASPPDRRFLGIDAEPDLEGHVRITVRDSGCGIPPETIDQLFQPFFTSKKNGMGAGLAICRSIMEFHGGRLYFEPMQTEGAAFVCCIPVSPS